MKLQKKKKKLVLQLSHERFNVCENLGSNVGERRLIRGKDIIPGLNRIEVRMNKRCSA